MGGHGVDNDSRADDVDKDPIRRFFWRAYLYEYHFLETWLFLTSRLVGRLCPIELKL
jgi:hypothetical protein